MLENGPNDSAPVLGPEMTNGSGESKDNTEDDTDNHDDTEAEYADTPTEGILNEYRQFATSVLDRSENTVDLHTRYIERLLEYANTPPSHIM